MKTDSTRRLLLDNTAEIIILFDGQGKICFGNKSALEKLEYTEEQLLEQSMCVLFQQEFQQAGEQRYAPFDVAKLKENAETVIYRKKSSCFPVSIRVCETEEERFLLFAEDMTWKKDMDARIRQIKEDEENNLRMRNEFTSNVTHELRTPVNGIRGHAARMLEQPVTPEQKKALDIILYCCDNMSSIINDILDFSKMAANKMSLEETKFDFYQMMDNVIATHIEAIRKKEIGIKIDVQDNVPQYIIGDSLRISQILNNLISNAVKFTKVGQISVDVSKTYQSGDVIELFFMVRDTGIGIAKEDQDKLFQSFNQVDASVTRNFGGTGLGLYITKQLVEMMRGKIWIESEKGKGSCFSFNIKVKAENSDEVEKDAILAAKKSWETLIGTEEVTDELHVFGSEENRKEIKRRMEKLVLSVELGSWDKAETLIDTIKSLIDLQEADFKRLILKVEMAVRKEDYSKSMAAYENLKAALDEKFGS